MTMNRSRQKTRDEHTPVTEAGGGGGGDEDDLGEESEGALAAYSIS